MIARMTKQLPPALLGPPRPRSLLGMFLFARAHLLQRSMLYIFLPPNSIKQTAYADTAATAISAGGQHTCAVLAVGGMTCWGSNSYGQLGFNVWEQISPSAEVLWSGRSSSIYVLHT